MTAPFTAVTGEAWADASGVIVSITIGPVRPEARDDLLHEHSWDC